MALVRWNPWTEMEALKREVDRLFEMHIAEMFSNGDTHRVIWDPRVDVRELDHAFVVEADLPGMACEDITVSLENNTLVIAGEQSHMDWRGRSSHAPGAVVWHFPASVDIADGSERRASGSDVYQRCAHHNDSESGGSQGQAHCCAGSVSCCVTAGVPGAVSVCARHWTHAGYFLGTYRD
jgi:HSP20 family molecular chaperone IbpA